MKFCAAALVAILAGCAAPSGDQAAHAHRPSQAAANHAAAAADTRVMVQFPEMLRTHTLANMRDHLLALAEIQDQLARGAYDKASDIAEQRLGMNFATSCAPCRPSDDMPSRCSAFSLALS